MSNDENRRNGWDALVNVVELLALVAALAIIAQCGSGGAIW